MGTFLFNLLQSKVFWVLSVIWIIVCIFDIERFRRMINRLVDLGNKPVIFKIDERHTSVPFYFRQNLEVISAAFKDFIIDTSDSLPIWLSNAIKTIFNLVYNPERPHRIIGYIFLFILFLFFVWADSVGIVSALDAFGIISFTIPEFLRYYEVAATVGSLFAVIVGIELLRELSASKSTFTSWDERSEQEKHSTRQLTTLLTISGFIAVVFLGLLRLYDLGIFGTIDSIMETVIETVLYVLVPFNTVLATALITTEFLMGLYLLVVAILSLLLLTSLIFKRLFQVVAYVLPVLLDFIYRILLIFADIVFYFLFTPLLLLIRAISSPFRQAGRN